MIDVTGRVLEVLYDRREGFVSPEELSEAAGARQERVDAAIEQLRRLGQPIEFVPPHGYRLRRPVRLDGYLIERDLRTRRVGRNVLCFDEVDSTNDVAATAAAQVGSDGLVVLAESQRAGRGRLGRAWLSPPGRNILMSVLLLDPHNTLPHDGLTIAAGLAAAEGVEASTGCHCGLGWPNDVLLDGRKLCGVLVELHTAGGRRCLVTGIGINVNACPSDDEVDQPATCLADHAGEWIERTEIVQAVLRRMDHWVGLLAEGRTESLHGAWLSRCGMLNRRLTVLRAGQRYVGRVLDISPREGLVLCGDDQRRIHLPAAGSTVLREGRG